MASKEPCKHRSGQFKESMLAVSSVSEWIGKTKHIEFSPSTYPWGILSRRCKVEPSVWLQRLRNLKSVVYWGDGDVSAWLDLLNFFCRHHFAGTVENVSQHPHLSLGMVPGGCYQGPVLTWPWTRFSKTWVHGIDIIYSLNILIN